ncbi:MAG: DUF115 domain-containing protein [Planctomycetes bacterium]|nr:DUF115 domain-containing protein [Planctomycetota bacterium]NOG53352.1 DUF115 domain-containing protein [Planctomycetota bacterium]
MRAESWSGGSLTHATLNRNLDVISRHSPRFADRVRQAAPTGDVELFPAKSDNALTGRYLGAALASAYRPIQESRQIADSVNVIDNAVVVVLGFGLGWHVRELSKRMRKTGVIAVYEPDLSLVRSVLEQIDHSEWLTDGQVVFFDDETDRAEIALRLDGTQAFIVQGTTIVEHPPSVRRLGDRHSTFSRNFTEFVAATRTTMMTTLVHSSTTCRNSLLNLDHYAGGAGIGDLEGFAGGHAGILIAAGPSLARNLALLENPDVRDKAVIIAVQTMLKPLLARGIRPHFVTALDYHELSGQFYEGLSAADVEGVTLIVEPKANRAIVEGFPGVIRCVGSTFLDQVLGPVASTRAPLRPGATVAHLSFYFAQFLGCDPIAMIGQDLAFTDGLYYGSGAAIHQQWGPEVNRFTSLEAMEWQRIVRMKRTLRQADGYAGRSVLIDEQMQTYLQQFERDFSDTPSTVIDATEGGSTKRNCKAAPLSTVLSEHVSGQSKLLPAVPAAPVEPDQARLQSVLQRVRELKTRTERLIEVSRLSSDLLDRMLADQQQAGQMQSHFSRMDSYRAEVEGLLDVMSLTNTLSQLGVFKRLKADRRIDLTETLEPMERQRLQLERDKINVDWLVESGEELCACFAECERVLQGSSVSPRTSSRLTAGALATFGPDREDTEAGVSPLASAEIDVGPVSVDAAAASGRVAAIIAVDMDQSDLGTARSLAVQFAGRTVLDCVIDRVARCESVSTVILLIPEGADLDLARRGGTRVSGGATILTETVAESELRNDRQRAVAVARRWSDTSWRGGIGGASVYDEIMRPQAMRRIMEKHDLAGALVVGADWALVDPGNEAGCGAIVARFREDPDSRPIVFSQSPPGLCGCVVSRAFMEQLATGARGSMIGAVLSYMPHLPQLDPIGKDLCIGVPLSVRACQHRFTFDTQHRRQMLTAAFSSCPESVHGFDAAQVVAQFEASSRSDPSHSRTSLPPLVELELTTDRAIQWYLSGSESVYADCAREPMTMETLCRVLEQLTGRDTVAVTLGGAGDPLIHPQFLEMVRMISEAGVSAIHVVTDLADGLTDAAQLCDLPIDVITVRLNADRAQQYGRLTKSDRFQSVISNLEGLINTRAERAGNAARLALPWIVPSLWRCAATLEDLKNLYDRWVYFLNAATIEPPPWLTLFDRLRASAINERPDELLQLNWPLPVVAREASRWMCIRSNGDVESDALDWRSANTVGSVHDRPVTELWSEVLNARHRLLTGTVQDQSHENVACGAGGA